MILSKIRNVFYAIQTKTGVINKHRKLRTSVNRKARVHWKVQIGNQKF